MRSLKTLAIEAVAKNLPIEIALTLPVELRERLWIYYDRETQLKHFGSWRFWWGYDCTRYTVKVTYQNQYTTISLQDRGNIIAELNLYAGQLHGKLMFLDDHDGVCIYIYKLGKIVSAKGDHPDGTPHYSIDYTGCRQERMYFKPGGAGQIDSYAYYSKTYLCYVRLISCGENVYRFCDSPTHTARKTPDWVEKLIAVMF